MNDSVTRLFLIRHAETEWNTAQIFQGRLDSPLTPNGLEQAAQLASRLASEGIAAIYSSDQGRAMQTAQMVANRTKLQLIPRSELREIDCGEWTGKSYQEVRTRWPEAFANWRSQPHLHQMPGGESVTQVQQRGLRMVEEIRRQHPGRTVCVVTHNTVVRSLLCHFQGRPLSQLWEGEKQPNCALNLIEFSGGRLSLLEIASTEHLSSISTIGFSV